MARLETQINQIFLVDPKNKSSEAILYEKKISSTIELYIIAVVQDVAKKNLNYDLKKISEIIISTFEANRKLNRENLFESSLAEINQQLADLAHSGRKAWLGKLSILLAIRAGNDLFLANSGQASCWLARNSQIFEILQAEKKGLHPLKMFSNFTSGKISVNDRLTLTSSNLFNYISVPLFQKLMDKQSLEQACTAASKIIKESNNDEALASFMLEFAPTIKEQATMVEIEEPVVYAPLEEEIIEQRNQPNLLTTFKRIRLPKIKWQKYSQASKAQKFFLASFLIFLLLFTLNLAALGIKTASAKKQARINQQYEKLTESLGQVESALIYKNDEAAANYLKQAYEEFMKLKKMDKQKASMSQPLLSNVANKVNRVSTVENPKIITTLRHSPNFLARAGSGFVFANNDPKTVSIFDGTNLKTLLLLNTVNGEIRGIVHAQANGNLAAGKDTIYRINQTSSQFDPVKVIPNADMNMLRFLSPNRVYTLDKSSNQVLRVTLGSSITTANLLKSSLDLKNAQDVGIDTDVYILFPDRLIKVVGGQPQEFKLVIADNISQANRIFVGSNIYILESGKKRLLIFNKQGKLLNQIFFPGMNAIKDLYVDENQRFIYLLDENKLLEITF